MLSSMREELHHPTTRSRILCGGRCVSGPDRGGVVSTTFIILLPTIIYVALLAPWLLTNGYWYVAVWPLATLPITLALLAMASHTDPGVIPRRLRSGPVVDDGPSTRTLKNVDRRSQTDFETQHKFCDTCLIYRPDRASHCRTCDNCVQNFDHHCPWISNCVGRNNYKYFILFTNIVVLDCILIMVAAAVAIAMIATETAANSTDVFYDVISDSELARPFISGIVLLVYSFCTVWSVIGLAGYHVHISAKNITTHESMTRSWGGSWHNARDDGLAHNLMWAYCAPDWPRFFPPASPLSRDTV